MRARWHSYRFTFAMVVAAIAGCAGNPPGPLAFVSNERSGTVSVIDLTSDSVIATIDVGGRPRGIRSSPHGERVYVALSTPRGNAHDQEISAIAEIDAASFRVVARHDAGSDPEQFAVATDGRLFVANEAAGTASIVTASDRRIERALAVGMEPEGVAISPDGRFVYVTAETSNSVTAIDAKADTVISTFLVDARPRDAAFSPDSRRAYVTSELGGSVSEIDVATHSIVRTLRLPRGNLPCGVLVSRSGKRLYVANGRGNSVSIIDLPDLRLAATVPAGRRVWGIALSPDEKRLYAANSLEKTITVIDTRSHRPLRTITVGDGPWGIAIVP